MYRDLILKMKNTYNHLVDHFGLNDWWHMRNAPSFMRGKWTLYPKSDFYSYIPSLYTPSSISHHSIFKNVDIRYDFYVFFNLSSSTYRHGAPSFTPSGIQTYTYKYRFSPYNWPVTNSLDPLQIRELLCYKNSTTCWYQQDYFISTILEKQFQTKSYDFLLYNRLLWEPRTSNYRPTYKFLYYKPYANSTYFTFNIPTIKGEVNQYTDNYHAGTNPFIRTIKGQTMLKQSKRRIASLERQLRNLVGSEKRIKKDKPKYRAWEPTNPGNSLNKSVTLEPNNSKNTLSSFNSTTRVYGDTIELPFMLEFNYLLIFLPLCLLLFILSLIFLLKSDNYRLNDLNFRISSSVLHTIRYFILLLKRCAHLTRNIFKWWRYP